MKIFDTCLVRDGGHPWQGGERRPSADPRNERILHALIDLFLGIEHSRVGSNVEETFHAGDFGMFKSNPMSDLCGAQILHCRVVGRDNTGFIAVDKHPAALDAFQNGANGRDVLNEDLRIVEVIDGPVIRKSLRG